eukprot:TRINITY_DN5029_c0_g1_i5.p1 TRINITY_DN5029_c0_g1~~TRINITY_DN5029_c0_g1_i5.p1  ORF type:complete len:429 (-),score=77.16 TRINITY_DN5029_c0_g1_i5:22-1308(-)
MLLRKVALFSRPVPVSSSNIRNYLPCCPRRISFRITLSNMRGIELLSIISPTMVISGIPRHQPPLRTNLCPRLSSVSSSVPTGFTSICLGTSACSFPVFRRSQHARCSAAAESAEAALTSTVVSTSEKEQLHPPGVQTLDGNIVDVLQERGLVDAITSDDLRKAALKPLRVYVGFDPTAESLHMGNLLGIIALKWFQRLGHFPVALLGGATGRVGDPSGKSIERPMMDEETIEKNVAGVKEVLETILNRAEEEDQGGNGARLVKFQKVDVLNNYDWWKDVSMLEFLRDVGKYARVGAMMAKESVKKRLNSDEGMSFTEFTYQLLQGYDFVHLYREKGITVQMGGSDQWGNITAGTDLIRRLVLVPKQKQNPEGEEVDEAYGLTWPLLLKSDGTKFGKSEGGAIWLSPKFISPYQFYQVRLSSPWTGLE